MIAPSPHSALPCSLRSHQPPSRAPGGTENKKTRENMAASYRRSGRKSCLFRKMCLWLYFEQNTQIILQFQSYLCCAKASGFYSFIRQIFTDYLLCGRFHPKVLGIHQQMKQALSWKETVNCIIIQHAKKYQIEKQSRVGRQREPTGRRKYYFR